MGRELTVRAPGTSPVVPAVCAPVVELRHLLADRVAPAAAHVGELGGGDARAAGLRRSRLTAGHRCAQSAEPPFPWAQDGQAPQRMPRAAALTLAARSMSPARQTRPPKPSASPGSVSQPSACSATRGRCSPRAYGSHVPTEGSPTRPSATVAVHLCTILPLPWSRVGHLPPRPFAIILFAPAFCPGAAGANLPVVA